MTDDDRAAMLADLDTEALALFGKPLRQCNLAEAEEIKRSIAAEIASYAAEIARRTAGLDQAGAAISEAERCGCDLLVPLDERGQPDVSRAQVDHTCDLADTDRPAGGTP